MLEKEAKKEIERIEKIMKNLKVMDSKADGLVKVLNSYHEDANSFYKKKQYLQALEATFIVWAYVDAGLHLGVFQVPESLRKMFTV
ncbi:MAG: DUF357 domain-containing protein [Candidatus Aenigmarchaeota archaeon]|nr:DUF357 domain-containing protein [Candidatus Aenigmarchaeota archaeon]